MARWAIAASVVLVFVGMGAVPAIQNGAQDSTRIAYVNTELILQQMPGYRAADSTLASEMQIYQKEMQDMQAQIDSARSSFDQQSLVLSPTAREERLNELRQMGERFNARGQELQTRSVERQRELVAPLQQRIQEVIDGVRAERNLGIIFDVGSPNSSVISADRSLDLTSLIITRLQASGS